MSAPDSLPLLPIAATIESQRRYSADQMHAYALAAVLAEREACAKAAEGSGLTTDSTGVVLLGDVDFIAALIRSRTKDTQ